MRHGRPDYDHITDPSGKIPEDEPVFLIRGHDSAGPEAVRAWAHRADCLGANPKIVADAYAWAREMEGWQILNGRKLPDRPDVPETGEEKRARYAATRAGQDPYADPSTETPGVLADGEPI